ncbi:hypothetical protein PVAND_013936 [Polypedilum vanderplanki]|uniref:F-box domain-containing protein n=1 Tax=Polypedilum vanderplanki TaxID=319348 RepID=A0A9J6CQV9_POLVA|nr:hypothetical protein PVAND_013936 [Polypedilum vanderplanki]
MNFLNVLPFEINELIFHHLSGTKLIEITSVSKEWNKFIGESKYLMKNVKINVNVDLKRISNLKEALEKSTRKYQHIEINSKLGTEVMIPKIFEIFKSKSYNVKTLNIDFFGLSGFKNLIGFIELFNETVEEMYLDIITTKKQLEELHNENEIFDYKEFPKLKILRVMNFGFDTDFYNFFTKCKNLVEFRIQSFSSGERNPNSIVEILHQNKNLKIFQISLDIFQEILENEEITLKFPFKLHTFESSISANYQNIFTSQFDSIQNLKISFIYCEENLKTIFKLPNLKKLYLLNLEGLYIKKNQLNVSESLEKLSIADFFLKPTTLNSIIRSSPNIKDLFIYTMNQETMKLVSRKMKQLESLRIGLMKNLDLLDKKLFPKIKNVQVDVLDRSLEEQLNAIPFKKRSKFVSLILASKIIDSDSD